MVITKKEKEIMEYFVIEEKEKSFMEGLIEGEKSAMKGFIDDGLDDMSQGYLEYSISSIIKSARKRIKQLEELEEDEE